MTPSRQREYVQSVTLRRLAEQIPHDCPIVVRRHESGRGYVVAPLAAPERPYIGGRFAMVAAFIDGFVRAWRALP